MVYRSNVPQLITRNIRYAFRAAPSDLDAERKKAKDVVAELNRASRSRDLQIEIVGWETMRAGIGRPQGIINPEIERCSIFIGAPWRRWGTPPALESPYSSGFEEEISIAIERPKKGPIPQDMDVVQASGRGNAIEEKNYGGF